jgi:hypothetical protein
MLDRPSINIAFSTDALEANLSRLEDEWEACQNTRDRDGIYRYLAALFELVMWWKDEQKATEYARMALSVQRRQLMLRFQIRRRICVLWLGRNHLIGSSNTAAFLQ